MFSIQILSSLADVCIQLQPFVCKAFVSFLECGYLTSLLVYSHSRVWIQDIPHEFHLFLLYSHLKINFFFNISLDFFFFFIFCMIIPKKGIFYWHTSTSFVIDCANKHVHNLNCQCIHGVFISMRLYWHKFQFIS